MLQTLRRAIGDLFTYGLLYDLTKSLTVEHEAYYLWGLEPEECIELLARTFTKPLVILAIKDNLDLWHSYDYWSHNITTATVHLRSCANRHPNQKFVFLTSLENLHKELTDVENLTVIPFGGDITNFSYKYNKLEPVVDKEYVGRTYISLNRLPRLHRNMVVSYLFSQGLNVLGDISFNTKDFPWTQVSQITPSDTKQKIILEKMCSVADQVNSINSDTVNIYAEKKGIYFQNNNAYNFQTSLRNRYKHSFIEIVSETTCSPSFMITEKTANAFVACNFPIINSGPGAVKFLREMGFDMFDDVIDHSYDLINDPIDRIVSMIDNNSDLLTNQDIYNLWESCLPRFLNNVETFRNMTSWYEKRASDMFLALDLNKI